MTTRIMTATAIAIAATLLLTILPSDTWTASGAPASLNPAKVGWTDSLDDNRGAMFALGTKIYSIGCGWGAAGYDPCTPGHSRTSQVVVYDTLTNQTTTHVLNYAVWGATAVVSGTTVYVLGGLQGFWGYDENSYKHVSTFNLETFTLTPATWQLRHQAWISQAATDATTGSMAVMTHQESWTFLLEIRNADGSLSTTKHFALDCGQFFSNLASFSLGFDAGLIVVAGCQQWNSSAPCILVLNHLMGGDFMCYSIPTVVNEPGLYVRNGQAVQFGGVDPGSGPTDAIVKLNLVTGSYTTGKMGGAHSFRWSLPTPGGTYLYGGYCANSCGHQQDCQWIKARCGEVLRYTSP